MEKYCRIEKAKLTSNQPVSKDEFGDIRSLGAVGEYTDVREESFWESIGVGGSITARAIVYDDKIYIGAYDKNFYCIDLDGKEVWRFQTNGIIQSHAACFNGLVYFGSGDGNVYCVTAKEGKLIWKFSTKSPMGSSTVVYEGRVYFGSTDGNLYTLDSFKGRLIWTFKTSYPLQIPLIIDDRIYVGYEGSCLYCLNLNGEMLWKFNTGGWVAAWPAAYDGDTLYFGSADKNLYAITVGGKLKWRYPVNGIALCPKAERGRVYFGCTDEKAYCLDSSGKKLWDFKAGGGVSELGIDGRVIFVPSYDNYLYAVDKNTGHLIWKFKTGGFVHTNPAVHEGRLIFGSFDCNLYCLDMEGNLLWKFRTSLSTPSPIHPPEQLEITKLELAPIIEEEKKKEDKYKPSEGLGDYEVERTTYSSGMSRTYISSRKKGYVSTTEF